MNPETNPETPVLMITLQIPVQDDTSADQILEAFGPQLAEALRQIKEQQSAAEASLDEDPEAIPRAEFNASVIKETQESYSDNTKSDLLATLGYAAK